MSLILAYINKASTWFLFGLLFLLCLNSFFAIQKASNETLTPTQYTQTIQVVRRNIQGGFGNSYLALSNIGLVNLDSSQSLSVGYSYQVRADILEYKLNDPLKPFDKYYRSLGIMAKFKIKSTKPVVGCSMDCWIISQVNNFQNWNLRSFGQAFCIDNYSILKLVGQSGCQDGYALSLGLMFGEDGYFSKELKNSFRTLGLTHLTAFSGMQTVLILTLLENLLLKIKFGFNYRYFLALLVMLLIIFVVGFSPPVLRSILSVLISMSILKFFGRKLSPYRCLIYSGAIMLIFNPLYIVNISFQLSFVATLGVILSGIFETKTLELNTIAKSVWQGFLQSGFCIVMTLPIILQLGSGNWLLALVMNIIFVPILNFLTLFNYLLLLPGVGYLLAPVLVAIQAVVTQVIIIIASISPKSSLIFNFEFWDYIFYYGTIGLICLSYFAISRARVKRGD